MAAVPLVRLAPLVSVLVITAAVWVASEAQRRGVEQADREQGAATEMLAAFAEQSDAAQAILAGEESESREYRAGRRRFDAALATSLEGVDPGEGEERRLVRRHAEVMDAWRSAVEPRLRDGRDGDAGLARGRPHQLTGRFLAANARLRETLEEERQERLRGATQVSVVLILALSALFGGVGYALTVRSTRRAAAGAAEQAEHDRHHADFSRALQVTRNEHEAHRLVKRYAERLVPGARATMLNRNNSNNRLESTTEVASGDALSGALRDAQPDSCLAVRMAQVHARRPGEDELLRCDVCGELGTASSCLPSVVGGEVIGALLVEHPEPPDARRRGYLDEAVAQASPVLANLRNLALAELRAATDSLTGLANSRAISETFNRMIAHSARTGCPLSLVLFDLDHFKRVNDSFGHGKGDQVLAAVSQQTVAVLRENDFAGRSGGEEFVLLLPDTDREGAVVAAERLRRALRTIRVAGVEQRISASFGIAVYPDEATDAEALMRLADRGLYSAKAAGRDQVATEPASAGAHGVPTEPASTGAHVVHSG